MRSCYNPENFKPYYPPTKIAPVPVAFETVRIPASVGDSKTHPPTIGQYKNKIVKYEADETIWIYDSLGNYTQIPTSTALVLSVNGKVGEVVLSTSDLENDSDYITGVQMVEAINEEAAARIAADNALSERIDEIPGANAISDEDWSDLWQ